MGTRSQSRELKRKKSRGEQECRAAGNTKRRRVEGNKKSEQQGTQMEESGGEQEVRTAGNTKRMDRRGD